MAFPRYMLSRPVVVVAIVALFCAMAIDYVEGKESPLKPTAANPPSLAPAPPPSNLALAPAPSNDGILIDQGIACLLMLVALVLTYLIHDPDLPRF